MIPESFLSSEPYSLGKEEKNALFFPVMKDLTVFHRDHCLPYRRILGASGIVPERIVSTAEVPALATSLFKTLDLLSVPPETISKKMTSSGTRGQQVSQVFLDRETLTDQSRALVRIISSFTGPKRRPLLILDSGFALKDPRIYSARGAGIMGFFPFGRDVTFAFNEKMELDEPTVSAFLEKHHGEDILLFGYTFMIWAFFRTALRERNLRFDFGANSMLFHVGGWKKLQDQAVDPERFREELFDVAGIRAVHDYYGMAEQLGSVFVACEQGHYHASIFSEVLIRRARDFSLCPPGEPGIIQILSILPRSYPGHSLLTEDEGVLLGDDGCACGRRGTFFKINGRLKNAELRGCSDTYAAGL